MSCRAVELTAFKASGGAPCRAARGGPAPGPPDARTPAPPPFPPPPQARRRWEQERQRRLCAQVTAPLSLLNGFLERVRADGPSPRLCVGASERPRRGPLRDRQQPLPQPCPASSRTPALVRCQRCCAPQLSPRTLSKIVPPTPCPPAWKF
ncbi:atherin-like [Zalophus californianus]|uniref:Atherin-like n=1 Tax=Zalophus californianus TaxID=9704 RepID=A0A6P9F2F7_ZALCA|nr:atherin-like [Zalophus californianus]